VPRWLRDLTGIHPTTDVSFGGDAPPKTIQGLGGRASGSSVPR
jgi:hypothetical protein